MIIKANARRTFRRCHGLTLVETVVALAIAGIVIAATVGGFVSLLRTTESVSYSLGANALAVQGYEQTRAAKWDAIAFPNVDEVVGSNFPPMLYTIDRSRSGTNASFATNYTTITTLSTNPLLKIVRVDCVTGSSTARFSPTPLSPTAPRRPGSRITSSFRHQRRRHCRRPLAPRPTKTAGRPPPTSSSMRVLETTTSGRAITTTRMTTMRSGKANGRGKGKRNSP